MSFVAASLFFSCFSAFFSGFSSELRPPRVIKIVVALYDNQNSLCIAKTIQSQWNSVFTTP